MNEKNVSQCDGGKKKLQHRALPILAVSFFFFLAKQILILILILTKKIEETYLMFGPCCGQFY